MNYEWHIILIKWRFAFRTVEFTALYSRLRPVKLNMPICSVMWSHVPGVPRAWSFSLSWALISRTLSAMVFTLSFLQAQRERSLRERPLWAESDADPLSVRWRAHHSAKSCGELRVTATMRAPWVGGLDHVVLTIFSIWDSTVFRLSGWRVTMVRFPTRSSDRWMTVDFKMFTSCCFNSL